MNTYLKNLLLFFCLFSGPLSWAQGDKSTDPDVPTYHGMRIHLTGLEKVGEDAQAITLAYTPINTGREPLVFGAPDDLASKVQILFDESVDSREMQLLKSKIRKALLKEEFSIGAGEIALRRSIKIWKKEAPEKVAKGSTTVKTEKENPTVNADPKASCADLELLRVKVVKQTKRLLVLEYRYKNAGGQRLDLPKGKDAPPLVVKASACSSERLNRGATDVGSEKVDDKSEVLKPKATATGVIKLDISRVSKYTPYIIIQLDSANGFEECDETNNMSVVKIY